MTPQFPKVFFIQFWSLDQSATIEKLCRDRLAGSLARSCRTCPVPLLLAHSTVSLAPIVRIALCSASPAFQPHAHALSIAIENLCRSRSFMLRAAALTKNLVAACMGTIVHVALLLLRTPYCNKEPKFSVATKSQKWAVAYYPTLSRVCRPRMRTPIPRASLS